MLDADIYLRLLLSSFRSNRVCSCFIVSFLVVVSHAVVIFHAVVVAHAVVVVHAVVVAHTVVVAHSGVTAVIAHIVMTVLSFTVVVLPAVNLEACDQWIGVNEHLKLNSPLALSHGGLARAKFIGALKVIKSHA